MDNKELGSSSTRSNEGPTFGEAFNEFSKSLIFGVIAAGLVSQLLDFINVSENILQKVSTLVGEVVFLTFILSYIFPRDASKQGKSQSNPK